MPDHDLDHDLDLDLLSFLRQQQHLLAGDPQQAPWLGADPDTGVLDGAERVTDDAVDVSIAMRATKRAAAAIHAQMAQRGYSAATWASHELHPAARDHTTVDFILTMDLLNFSFWSDRPEPDRFAVEYRGRRWSGYWSLVAALRRACDEGIPITSSDFWQSEDECNLDLLRHVFRSCTDEPIPLLPERLACLREAGQVLYDKYHCSFGNVIGAAAGSAAALVNILAADFSCFRDEARWEGSRRPIRFLKRAQILVADLWACFEGRGPGAFRDIDKITMFADYRVPQMLNTMGCLCYSPPLAAAIAERRLLGSGHPYEIQLRACSIWCVELIRREIVKNHPAATVNAILIDFFLYDTMKEMEAAGQETVQHHRTRSIWY